MTSKSKLDIKAFFQTSDTPTEAQFIDLIDSYVDKSGPLGVLETAVSGGSTGFVYASAADADIIGAAAALTNLGVTVYTTALAVAAVASTYTTTAQAAAQTGTYRGAVAYRADGLSIAASTFTVITCTGESIDTDSIHSVASNQSRMTVPSGVTKVRLIGQIGWPDTGADTNRDVRFYKNGAAFPSPDAIGRKTRTTETGTTDDGYDTVISPAVSCAAGDYFELVARHTHSVAISAYADQTWFEMQILA